MGKDNQYNDRADGAKSRGETESEFGISECPHGEHLKPYDQRRLCIPHVGLTAIMSHDEISVSRHFDSIDRVQRFVP
jgi:hypothetical protein